MRQLRFKQVDVFTRRPFYGNPVAVVLEADRLSGEDMQRIASWTNLSETTFVLPPSSAAADYKLRIFTPRMELPFAGHPTIGSAHAVLEAGKVKANAGLLRQECGAGVINLSLEGETLWLEAPRATETRIDASDIAAMEAAIGARAAGRPFIVNVGPRWLVAQLENANVVGGLKPDMASLTALSDKLAVGGVTVFGAAGAGEASLHVRSFAPAHGIPEDPVCGSGNISVAAYLEMSGGIDKVGRRYTARQGMQLGRDGRVALKVEAGKILLGGSAVTCVEGTLRV